MKAINKGWLYVVITCILELVWVMGFNFAQNIWHWLLLVGIILIDFNFLIKACELLPTGTVYAIFAAAGTIGTSILDTLIFNAPFSFYKGLFIFILVAGVISLKLADSESEKEAV